MTAQPVRLSKSKLATFEHCPKRLWFQVHRRHEAKFEEATLARFQFGHDVGKRARLLVSDGILIDTGMDMAAALQQTAELIASGHRGPIFEATFQHENVLVRVDILQPVDANAWEIVEVKGSSRVGGYHLADVASQVWVARGCGLDIAKATVRHLTRRVNWRCPDIGGITFRDVDVSEEIERFVANRPKLALAAGSAVAGPLPVRSIGMHCYRPFACEFREYCCLETIEPTG